MAATPQLLAVILALKAAIESISATTGCFYTVPPGGVVLDAVDLVTVQLSPFSILGGNLDALRVQRELTDLTGTRIQDTVTIPIVTRLDVPGTGFLQRLTAWTQWTADVERVLGPAALGAGQVLNGLTVIAWPQVLHAPMMGTPDKPFVVPQIDIQLVLKNRTYGQP